VVELARAISLHPAVHRVELLTRLIADPKVRSAWSQQGMLNSKRTPRLTDDASLPICIAQSLRLPCCSHGSGLCTSGKACASRAVHAIIPAQCRPASRFSMA